MGELLLDLLNSWPFVMWPFWVFPLFFAGKFIRLGWLGLCGRGIPIFNSKRRWSNVTGRAFSVVLVIAGFVVVAAFGYWLVHALVAGTGR